MTSNHQLYDYCMKHPHFGGVVSKDELAGRTPEGKFWIVNLQDSRTGGGTHWCLAYDCGRNPFYGDPYGISPPPEIADFLHRSKNAKKHPPVYSKTQYQTLSSDNCGAYCLIFTANLLCARAYDHGLDDTAPSQHNERVSEGMMAKIKRSTTKR